MYSYDLFGGASHSSYSREHTLVHNNTPSLLPLKRGH